MKAELRVMYLQDECGIDQTTKKLGDQLLHHTPPDGTNLAVTVILDLASRTVRQYVSVVQATQFVVLCLWQP